MKQLLITLIFFISAMIFVSCSVEKPDITGVEVKPPVIPVQSIAVMPVISGTRTGSSGLDGEARVLTAGALYADSVIIRQLADNQKVQIVTPSQLSALEAGVTGGLSATISEVGRQLNTEAVLVTTMHKFQQRQGGEYAVDEPASASFDMRLVRISDNNVIWAADFNETQQSYLSNLLTLGKAKDRGFKWITVEDLVSHGLRERLAECPHL